MKRSLLMTSAAIALALGLTPALAQQDRNDSKVKRDPAATEQRERQSPKAMPVHDAQQGAASKDRAGARDAAGRADDANSDKARSAETDKARSGADSARGAANDKSPAQPKQAEDRDRKPASNTAGNKPNSAEPTKNAEHNDSRSPAAQKSTESREPNRNTPANAKANDTDRNAKTNDANRNSAAARNDSEPKTRISASLDTHKRTQLTTAFARVNIRPIERVNFSVSGGVVVPRNIEFRPIPASIVEIVPQYRGYDFFVVREEIVINKTNTQKNNNKNKHKPSRARAETTTVRRPNLSTEQREIIRRHATSRRTTTTGAATRTTSSVTAGERLPDSVEVETFPEEVYREVPAVREYRYIERGNDMYLIDPSSRTVIEEVR